MRRTNRPAPLTYETVERGGDFITPLVVGFFVGLLLAGLL